MAVLSDEERANTEVRGDACRHLVHHHHLLHAVHGQSHACRVSLTKSWYFFYFPSHNFHFRANGKWRKFRSFFCSRSRLSWNVYEFFLSIRHSMFRSQLKIHLCKTAELRIVDSWGSVRARQLDLSFNRFSATRESFFLFAARVAMFLLLIFIPFPSSGWHFFGELHYGSSCVCAPQNHCYVVACLSIRRWLQCFERRALFSDFIHYYRNHVPLHNWRDLSLIMSLSLS